MTEALEIELRQLVARLLEVNAQFNLTSIREPNEAWTKHILDSLQGLESGLFESAQNAVDVGAGAGFPGLPLALARRSVKWSFVEATRKKCGFIQTMSDEFDLGAQIVHARAEEAGHDAELRERFDVATARAIGSFSEVAELCLPLVRVGGNLLLWRGQNAEEEAMASEEALDELGAVLRDVTAYELPGHELTYHLVTVEKVNNTPRRFPRSVGLPKKKPLGG